MIKKGAYPSFKKAYWPKTNISTGLNKGWLIV